MSACCETYSVRCDSSRVRGNCRDRPLVAGERQVLVHVARRRRSCSSAGALRGERRRQRWERIRDLAETRLIHRS